jgi:response regulator RpfG family c-di-GMP phosphodiesterase
MMPNVDGLEATRRLRADPATEGTPIIILSAMTSSEDIVAGLEAGADEYLAKPLKPKEFAVRIRTVMRLRRAWCELRRSYGILGEHSRFLTLLLEFSAALARTEELEPILDRTIEVAATLTCCRRVSIFLLDPDRQTLQIARSSGPDDGGNHDPAAPVSAAIAERIFSTGQLAVCNTETEARAFAGGRALGRPANISAGSLPMVSVPMCAAERTVGVLNATDRIGRQPFCIRELEYLNLLTNTAASAIQNVLTRKARDEARNSILIALAKLAELRDDDTGRHVNRVTMYCLTLAKELRRQPKYAGTIDAEFLHNIQNAAPLHDIGKVAIPDSILLKPGKLTPDEMAVMRSHVAVGSETIRSVIARTPDAGFLKMGEEIAQGHHEWFDGTGYPLCISGVDIPLAARILALADVFDALTTKRVYKEAMPHEQAVEIILKHAGTQFDPDIVEAFRQCLVEFQRLAGEMSDRAPEQESGERSPGSLVHSIVE